MIRGEPVNLCQRGQVMSNRAFILASASPRRRELLHALGANFDICPAPIDEPDHKPDTLAPHAWVLALAYYKARAVADLNPDRWVLGADTVVVCGGHVLGKPRGLEHARAMLIRQAGHPSDVVTGIAFVRSGVGRSRVFRYAATRIWMRDAPAIREGYLASGAWRGKAGAYGLQDVGDKLVAKRAGSWSNVVGLPTEVAEPVLRSLGLLN